jgi:hypothetical protein
MSPLRSKNKSQSGTLLPASSSYLMQPKAYRTDFMLSQSLTASVVATPMSNFKTVRFIREQRDSVFWPWPRCVTFFRGRWRHVLKLESSWCGHPCVMANPIGIQGWRPSNILERRNQTKSEILQEDLVRPSKKLAGRDSDRFTSLCINTSPGWLIEYHLCQNLNPWPVRQLHLLELVFKNEIGSYRDQDQHKVKTAIHFVAAAVILAALSVGLSFLFLAACS